jgi:hypothetical protein
MTPDHPYSRLRRKFRFWPEALILVAAATVRLGVPGSRFVPHCNRRKITHKRPSATLTSSLNGAAAALATEGPVRCRPQDV